MVSKVIAGTSTSEGLRCVEHSERIGEELCFQA